LLARCHGRKATGERDAVFALLSLAEDTSPRDWNIDYKISALDVYQEAVVNIIRTGNLDIICQASSCHPHSSLPRFGSSSYVQMSGIPQKLLSMSLEEETLLTLTAGNNKSRYCASGNSIALARNKKTRFDLW
jgi:hypothetical protein